LHQIEIEKASIERPRHAARNPEEVARRADQMREYGARSQRALAEAERRAEMSPEHQTRLSQLARRGKELKAKSEIGENFEARLAYVQARPELAETVGAEVKSRNPLAKIAVGQLLSGQGNTAVLYRKALLKASETEDRSVFDTQVNVSQSGPLQETRRKNAFLGAGVESYRASPAKQDEAQIARLFKDYEDLLEDAGGGALVSKVKTVLERTNRNMPELAVRSLRHRLEDLRDERLADSKIRSESDRPWYVRVLSGHMIPGDNTIETQRMAGTRPTIEKDIAMADALHKFIEVLEKMEGMKHISDAAKDLKDGAENLKRSRQNRPTLAPVNARN